MLLVFSGQNHSPIAPGAHTFIGSCETIEEARVGASEWARQQRLEWFNVLAQKHPREQASAMSQSATFWHQIVEFDVHGGAMKVLEETKPDWQPSHDSHELHAAREALDAIERMEEQGTGGDPAQAEAEHGEYVMWLAEWKRRRERKP